MTWTWRTPSILPCRAALMLSAACGDGPLGPTARSVPAVPQRDDYTNENSEESCPPNVPENECVSFTETERDQIYWEVLFIGFCVVNATKHVSVARTARALGIDRKTLHNRFARDRLPGPREILAWCRLLVAAHLLENSGCSFEQVGFAIGCASTNRSSTYSIPPSRRTCAGRSPVCRRKRLRRPAPEPTLGDRLA